MTELAENRLSGEEGMITAFFVVISAALFLLAGLVIDGGMALAARVKAADIAQAAARAGAQAVDLTAYRQDGQVTLDPDLARSEALAYLAATGDQGTVSVSGDEVQVTVTVTQPMAILDLVGIGHLTLSGSGAAVAEQGIEDAGQ